MSGSRIPPNCRHSQGRICENLKFGLQQMKYRGQKDAYKAVVDAIAVGPEVVRTAEAEDILGLTSEIIHKARARRGISIEDETDVGTRLQKKYFSKNHFSYSQVPIKSACTLNYFRDHFGHFLTPLEPLIERTV